MLSESPSHPISAWHRADNAPPRARRSWLFPREHGAYGQLLFPLFTALALSSWGLPGVLLAGAAVALFVAHEPLLVLLGHRGARAEAAQGQAAWRQLLVLVPIAGVLGGIGIALSPLPGQLAVALPLALAAGVGRYVARRAEKTTAAELLVAAALTSSVVPTMLANGAAVELVAGVWGVWIAAFWIATLAVRGVIARSRSKASAALWRSALGTAALTVAVTGGLALRSPTAGWLFLGTVPIALCALALYLLRPSARQLRPIGWSIMGSCVVTTTLLVAGLS